MVMEYAKDEVFGVRYQGDIIYQTKEKKKWMEFLKRNYFIIGLAVIGGMFCLINAILIYHFVSLLGTL